MDFCTSGPFRCPEKVEYPSYPHILYHYTNFAIKQKRGISMQAQRYLSFIHQTSLLRQSSPSDFHLNPICNGDTPCKGCLFGKSMPFNLRCHRHHSTRQVYHLSCTGRLQRSYQWHGQFPCSCQKQAGYCHYTDKCPRFVR